MRNIAQLRSAQPVVVSIGTHPGIIQSMLDYDYMVGASMPSVRAIVANGRKQERYFWGEKEITIPVVKSIHALDRGLKESCTAVLNVQSARRVLSTVEAAVENLPNIHAMTIFAENTPEIHALKIAKLLKQKNILVAGPSSVGILFPGVLKLGAIGGTQYSQLAQAGIADSGDTAVISTSGGMVNELIHTVAHAGHAVSLAIALGGDRFPITSPAQALLIAQQDAHTKRIVYFGELGGNDEYEIAALLQKKSITKEVVVYVAGVVADLFETPPQFGHAKAIAKSRDESAAAKKAALRDAGAVVCDSFNDIAKHLAGRKPSASKKLDSYRTIGNRSKALVVSHISGDIDGDIQLLGEDLLDTVHDASYAQVVVSLLMGQQVKSERLVTFVDYVLRLLVDHGPYVSGAVNTIVAARAGKDLVSSLASGLLTIGPRFGGAINAAAGNWLEGVSKGIDASTYVESFTARGGIIAGIGHKKYRIDNPDPRVRALAQFSGNNNEDRYLNFAESVEAVTTTKKGNLILNVDGMIAAILLDIIESELRYSEEQLRELVDIEFFNALFVLARSVGLTAHYLDQRRHDEGLLRLPDNLVSYIQK